MTKAKQATYLYGSLTASLLDVKGVTCLLENVVYVSTIPSNVVTDGDTDTSYAAHPGEMRLIFSSVPRRAILDCSICCSVP